MINKVTVITLTYNNWEFLQTSISSVMKQQLKGVSVEYLIVDDGSEHFDINYVQSLITNTTFDTKIILNKINMGTVASFNNAIKYSTGDLIIPLSADDEFYDEYVIKKLINIFNVSNALVLTGIPISKSKKSCNIDTIDTHKELFKSQEKLLSYLLVTGNIISGAATYYRREIFDKIGYFDERYYLLEDYPFYIKCLGNGVCIHLFDEPVIKYSVDGVSSAKNMHPKLVRDYEILNAYILSLPCLSIFEKRRIFFNRVLDKKSKIKLINFFKYFDQYILYFFTRFIKK